MQPGIWFIEVASTVGMEAVNTMLTQMEISANNRMENVVPSLLCLKSFGRPIQCTQYGTDTNLTINYVQMHVKEVRG